VTAVYVKGVLAQSNTEKSGRAMAALGAGSAVGASSATWSDLLNAVNAISTQICKKISNRDCARGTLKVALSMSDSIPVIFSLIFF
jgi:hypothetical protein